MKKIKEKPLMKLIGKLHKYKKMLSYCYCRINTKNINPKISETSNGKTMILSNFAICGSKKSKSVKNQEANRLLSSLGIKISFSWSTLL